MSYLIIESLSEGKVTNISKSTPKKAIFEAVLQTADVKNRNNRIYPKHVIDKAMKDAQERINDRILGGELDHPIPTSDEQYSSIRHITPALKEMSHIITEWWWDGNKLMARIETTSTPSGYILAGLIYDRVKVGFSVRALSSNVEYSPSKGAEIVQEPMTIIAFDAVSMPSHHGAVIQEVKHLEQYLPELENSGCKAGLCVLQEAISKFENNSHNKLLEHYNYKNIFRL